MLKCCYGRVGDALTTPQLVEVFPWQRGDADNTNQLVDVSTPVGQLTMMLIMASHICEIRGLCTPNNVFDTH